MEKLETFIQNPVVRLSIRSETRENEKVFQHWQNISFLPRDFFVENIFLVHNIRLNGWIWYRIWAPTLVACEKKGFYDRKISIVPETLKNILIVPPFEYLILTPSGYKVTPIWNWSVKFRISSIFCWGFTCILRYTLDFAAIFGEDLWL